MHVVGKLWLPALALVASMASALAESPSPARESVKVGVVGAISDAPFYIGIAKGFYRDAGLDIETVNFKEAAQMVAPVATGQLDVGGGAPSAALYNALARGIGARAVADKGSMPPHYGYVPLIVRKDLVQSGKFTSLADLKGLKVGTQSPGGAATLILDHALRQAGLTLSQVDLYYMGHPDLAVAVDNGAIDAAFITEPNATHAVRLGHAVRFMTADQVYPNQQLAIVLYSAQFAEQHPDAAKRFMLGYLRSARLYNDALKDGRMAGPAADEVIAILTQSTTTKDPTLYREIVPGGCNPDGILNVASLQADLDDFRAQGLVKDPVTAAQMVDDSYARAAVAQLGPYKPAQ